ncbi:MAG: DUF4340 domain-containing protein [Gammaproteobacteria bacterium]|nr:DUF4340 domain-containing protein [Gammaproteobacteria bacterium]
MLTSRTLLNLALALALAGLIALAVIEPGKQPTPTASRLTSLAPEAIQQIRLHAPGQADIDLQRVAGQWQMRSPYAAPANQQRIDQLLQLPMAKSQARYPFTEIDADQLQLASPALTIRFDDTRFELGGTAPLDGSRYVRIGDTVHLFTDRYSHLTRGPATDFISPALLDAADTITALTLPALRLILRDGHWLAEGPAATPTPNPDHLQQLLAEWRQARATAVQVLAVDALGTDSITVTTARATLEFRLRQTDEELILQRQDLGLQYHFPRAAGQRLLSLPSPADA